MNQCSSNARAVKAASSEKPMMSAVLLGLMHFMPAWDEGHMLERFMRLGMLVVAGVVVYFGMLLLQGFRLRDFNRKSLS